MSHVVTIEEPLVAVAGVSKPGSEGNQGPGAKSLPVERMIPYTVRAAPNLPPGVVDTWARWASRLSDLAGNVADERQNLRRDL